MEVGASPSLDPSRGSPERGRPWLLTLAGGVLVVASSVLLMVLEAPTECFLLGTCPLASVLSPLFGVPLVALGAMTALPFRRGPAYRRASIVGALGSSGVLGWQAVWALHDPFEAGRVLLPPASIGWTLLTIGCVLAVVGHLLARRSSLRPSQRNATGKIMVGPAVKTN
ncbi:MAG: hypothetical protein KGJ23_10095 [Euryarchaeota archaeon]|nr:hypothetical protein [Euryarchaeota archaeon]MDE1836955.1 hypothetical protein [Euryarchaeota archaeon]MDE1881929.1 hypothetical protein [Euryarchaeota archaeon]MDE2045860.1 hypothetical protein [Thermoplasmata archaeon]